MQTQSFRFLGLQPVVLDQTHILWILCVEFFENVVLVGGVFLPGSCHIVPLPHHHPSNFVFLCLFVTVNSPAAETCFSESIQSLEGSLCQVAGEIVHLPLSHILTIVYLPHAPPIWKINESLNDSGLVFGVLEGSFEIVQVEPLTCFCFLFGFFFLFDFFGLRFFGFLLSMFFCLCCFLLKLFLYFFCSFCFSEIDLETIFTQEHFPQTPNNRPHISHLAKPSAQVHTLFTDLRRENQLEEAIKLRSTEEIGKSHGISNKESPQLELVVQHFHNSLDLLNCVLVLLRVGRHLAENLPIDLGNQGHQLSVQILNKRVHFDFGFK